MTIRSTTLRLLGVGLALIGATAVVSDTASAASRPIGPNEPFTGLVNGVADRAVIRTVCPGPVWKGRTGPVAGEQSLAVVYDRAGDGSTGPGQSAIFAWVDGDLTSIVEFRQYGVKQAFPSTLRVPCDGAGRVTFSSCTPLMLCITVPVPDVVDVQFVNIAR